MQSQLVWQLYHRGAPPDGSHEALIPILEWLTRLTGHASGYLSPDMLARLHRHRPELRQNLSIRGHFTHVTYDEDLRVVRNAQIGIELDAPAAALRQSE